MAGESTDRSSRVGVGDVRHWLTVRIAAANGSEPADIGLDTPFEMLGITSTEAVSISGELEEWLGLQLPQALLYEHATVDALAGALAELANPSARVNPSAPVTSETPTADGPAQPGTQPSDPVCLVGMACRFPEADSPDRFWANLLDGVDASAEVPADRWDAAARYHQDPDAPGTAYTTRGAFVRDLAGFDAAFFGISPREALRMDPQQRMLLEVGWEALEGAGLAADRLRGSRTGVFVGMMAGSQYAALQLEQDESCLDDPYYGIGSASSVVAGRISYLFDFHGPSLTVDTACSSSLVALHLAVDSVLRGDCDRALVGGVSATAHPDAMRQACKMRMLAVDGACKTFDAAADGFLLGEGCGVVVVERLSQARARGHQVLAVVRGTAVNQDGATNGLTAPNRRAQVAVVRAALARAGAAPAEIGYVEAHGSGTALGDAIEVSALHEVFAADRAEGRPLVIGAVKTNVGHLIGAAGMAGLIKTVLALRHGRIPANLHLTTPNPAIDWDACPTLLPDRTLPWPDGGPSRMAGVSSFGWAGSNAHIVLEQAPEEEARPVPAPADDAWQALLVSARSGTAVAASAAGLLDLVDAPTADRPAPSLADLAFTTQTGRSSLEYRASVVGRTPAEVRSGLAALADARVPLRQAPRRGQSTPVTLLLPGTGDQYPGMARQLYEQQAVFRQALDLCADEAAQLGVDVLSALFPADGPAPVAGDLRALLGRAPDDGTAESPLTAEPEVAHAAVFALDYACATLWQSFGVRPAALIGYSLGEYAAACLAGVMSPPDAVRVVVQRARLLRSAPPGAMLAVGLAADATARLLTGDLSLAAVNGPLTSVVSGPEAAVARLAARLERQGVAHRRVPTTRAMHSPVLEPLRDDLVALLSTVDLRAPQTPLVSNLTGAPLSAERAVDPRYWADHMCGTVRFEAGVRHLAENIGGVVLEAGSGQLTSLVTQICTARGGTALTALAALPPAHRSGTEQEHQVRTAARLWEEGVRLDWTALHAERTPRQIELPSYPFEHQRFWPGPAAAPPRPDPDAEWLYRPQWHPAPVDSAGSAGPFLVLADRSGVAAALVEQLEPEAVCAVVTPADGFAELGSGRFTVRPDAPEDYTALLRALAQDGFPPRTVVQLWSLTGTDDEDRDPVERTREQQRFGFQSLVALGPALGAATVDGVRLLVVTDRAQSVSPGDDVRPDQATVVGACLTIPQEHPGIACRTVDVQFSGPADAAEVARRLVVELGWPGTDRDIAYRGGERFTSCYELLPPAPTADGTVLRERGTYLITGGLGGVGLLLAGYLARRYHARLVLVGRSGLPDRAEWPAILDSSPGSATAGRIRGVQELEQAGAEVLVAAADVADRAAVRAVLAETRSRFGALHGLIHAAGTTSPDAFAAAADLTPAMVESHFGAKVYGTLELAAALDGEELDFRTAVSSMSAVLGGIGFSAYAAANAFLDRFAQHAEGWQAVNWDTWQSTADAVDAAGPGATLAEHSMTAEVSLRRFERVLADAGPRLVVAADDLAPRLRQWVPGTDPLDESAPAPRPAPAALFARPALAQAFLAPTTDHERRLAALWQAALGISDVGVDDNFFDLGGNSLVGLQLVNAVKKEFRRPVPAVALFEAPTIATMARYLADADDAELTPGASSDATSDAASDATGAVPAQPSAARSRDIAIIGMAGRFPGAANVERFWENLSSGTESITFFTEEELIAAGVPAEEVRRPDYVRARPVLDGIDLFDAEFFGYTPFEARLADPQQRLFLECVWESLEHAGYAPRSTEVPVGVFGGANISTYLHRLAANPELLGGANDYQIVISNDKDSLTLNASYKLNLRGPSLAVQTFCSTSLVALHLACRSLLDGECGMAVAGGVSVRVPDRVGHVYQEGGMETPDGHVRTFDADARGAIFGDGCAVVVLKRLEDALADGDTVAAVVKGSAINNDGSLKVGFTAPSVRGQSEVVARAQAAAGVDPRTVSYIEAHGTATELGDPIEVAALTRAFGKVGDKQYCAIGSVKTNVGHLDRAAGAAGLIKTVLSMQHRQLPPSLHYRSANPEIDFENSPFYVNTELTPWQVRDGVPRRAGVNSLGMGGTNVHVVLEEAPQRRERPPEDGAPQLIAVSARTEDAVRAAAADLAAHLRRYPETRLDDVAHTLQVGRERFEHRLAFTAGSTAEAAAVLESLDGPSAGSRIRTVRSRAADRPIVLALTGIPEDRTEEAVALYRAEPAYRAAVDRQLVNHPEDRARLASPGPAGIGATAGFALELGLALLLQDWGVRCEALVVGGEGGYPAAVLTGRLTADEAIRALALRQPAPFDAGSGGIPGFALVEGEVTGLAEQPGRLLVGFAADRLTASGDATGLGVPVLPTGEGGAGHGAAGLRTALAELWLRGAALDWSAVHPVRPHRIPLPTYPFQRRSFWVEAPRPQPSGQRAALPDDPGEALAALARQAPDDWFYVPGWRQIPAARPAVPPTDPTGAWLLLGDGGQVVERLAAGITAAGGTPVLVSPGAGLTRTDRLRWTVDPGRPDDYTDLLTELVADGLVPRCIVHLWALGPLPDGASAPERYLHSLTSLARAVGEAGLAGCRLRIVTDGAHRIVGTERIDPEKALVTGPVKVIPLEFPDLDTRQLDLDPGRGRAGAERAAAEILGECADSSGPGMVAIRGGRRWVPQYDRLTALPAPDLSVLRPEGVYLVTGGLGGIGMAMAERLAATVDARLVLVSRTGLPDRDRWNALLDASDTAPELRRRIENVRALEAAGAEVLVVAADVANEGDMQKAVNLALGSFGRLDGVLHAAGLPGMGLMAFKDPESSTEVLAPKVAGTRALLAALNNLPLDFVVLFSSTAAVNGGGPGQADYCSANAYLDAVAQAAAGTPRILALDWGEWQWNGWDLALAGFDERATEFLRTNRERIGIGFDEGWDALLRALALGEPQLVVSSQDVPQLIEVGSRITVDAIVGLGRTRRSGAERHPRPELQVPFTAPEGDLALRIAAVWCDTLGLVEVGVHDDFFQLGGNSLLGMELIARIRPEVGGVLPPHVLYEAPTIAGLLRHLEQGSDTGADALAVRHERGAALRRNLAARHADADGEDGR